MAGGEESFASGSPSSQVINRGTPEGSVEGNPPVDPLAAVVSETPFSPPAARVPPEITTTTMTGTTGATVADPKFGGAYPGSTTVKWIGGVPKEDFSGVFNMDPATPLCIRGLDPVSEMKGYNKCVTDGYSIKFKRDDPDFNLMAFADAALSHMQEHGMDTVFYMKGAKDASGEGAEELFTYHSKYTKSQVDKIIADGLSGTGTGPKYDKYAVTALKDSAQWLSNSLDESLKSSLRALLAERPSGPQLWMLIVTEVQSDSLQRCTILVKQFQALTLAQFKGENVREYAKKADALLTQLERDDQLPHTHLLDIIDHLTACSIMDFKIHFINKRSEVEVFVKQTFGKSKQAVAAMPDKIHFRDLLEGAKEKYNNLQHKWGNKPNDEKAFTNQVKALQAKLEKMDQQLKAAQGSNNPAPTGGGRGKWAPPKDGQSEKKIINGEEHCYCRKCKGGKGFWTKGEDKHVTSQHKDKPKGGPGKWNPPKEGEPKEKMIDGVKMYYCKTCNKGKGRWNKTHPTSDHKTKEQLDAAKEAGGGHMAALPPAEANLADLFCKPVDQALVCLGQWEDEE